jgi:hypothetical protein
MSETLYEAVHTHYFISFSQLPGKASLLPPIYGLETEELKVIRWSQIGMLYMDYILSYQYQCQLQFHLLSMTFIVIHYYIPPDTDIKFSPDAEISFTE